MPETSMTTRKTTSPTINPPIAATAPMVNISSLGFVFMKMQNAVTISLRLMIVFAPTKPQPLWPIAALKRLTTKITNNPRPSPAKMPIK